MYIKQSPLIREQGAGSSEQYLDCGRMRYRTHQNGGNQIGQVTCRRNDSIMFGGGQ
ncbi:MAG: hypothetical protein KA314_15940 [Chloroflexi bacterium]|nr:hypothetical protein [Chloroflexota bacterium]MBP8057327.1 hypothetical protein [Chloroflexota bacterium]